MHRQPAKHVKLLTATAVGLTVFLIMTALHGSGLFAVAEHKMLDHRFQQYANPKAASPDLVLVAIDEASLETFGRWPWPRDRHGYMVHYLKHAGVRAIIFDVTFPEPDSSAEEFDAVFAEETKAAGNVFLPYELQSAPPSASSSMNKATLVVEKDARDPPPQLLSGYQGIQVPIPILADAARGLGYINLFPDQDGVTRSLPLLAESSEPNRAFVHLSVSVASYLLKTEKAVLTDQKLRIGPASIPLTSDAKMVLNWHGPLELPHNKGRTYKAYSAGALLKAYTELQKGQPLSLDPALFKDKIVFVAGTAAGTYDLRVTPVSPYSPGVLIHMTALDNILQGRYMRPAPYWLFLATMVALCLSTAWSFMLLQQQTLKFSAVAGLALGYYGLAVHAFTSHGLWLELAFPEGAVAATFALAASVEYLTEGRQRRQLRAAFDRYMAPEVVDEIMRHPEIKLGGEKKELSVLFSDIAGFTTVSEQLSPEALVELLNEYLSAMTDIIRRHRGNVNKYLGDGIMAIFGAPLGEPTHPTLACYAALESQQVLKDLRADWQRRGLPVLSARIGINTGPLVVGNMGSQARMEYTVMGDSVNLASRLEGANKYYDTLILLGPRTYELAQQNIEAREVDRLRVKGKHEPVMVYELMARKGQLDDAKHQLVELYRRGLAAYKARDFNGARNDFAAALKLDSTDGPSNVYLHRAQDYLITPPLPEWDGVYELRSK